MKKEATFTVVAGEVIDLLDLWVTDQAGWEKYDTYGTEKAVYKCSGGSVPFYVYVDDDTAGYAEIICWEGWDNVNHSGTGNSTTVQYIVKYACDWRVIGDIDHMILYSFTGPNYARGFYVGYTTPILAGDTKSIICIASNTNNSTYGFVSCHNTSYGYWLFKYGGGVSTKCFFYHPIINDDLAIAINGESVVLFAPYVGEDVQAKRARGVQKSIYGDGSSLITGFSVNDTIYLDTIPYVARQVYSSYCWLKNA